MAARRWTGLALWTTAGAAAAIGAGVAAVRRHESTEPPANRRWHAVTVLHDDLDLTDGTPDASWPAPIGAFGARVQARALPAPGGRGTELHVKPVDPDLTGGEVRRALREARALLEGGGGPGPDRPANTEPTPRSPPLQAAIRAGRTAGRL